MLNDINLIVRDYLKRGDSTDSLKSKIFKMLKESYPLESNGLKETDIHAYYISYAALIISIKSVEINIFHVFNARVYDTINYQYT